MNPEQMQRLEQKIDSLRELFDTRLDNMGENIAAVKVLGEKVEIQEQRWSKLFGGAIVVGTAIAILFIAIPSILNGFILDTLKADDGKAVIISIIEDKFFE